MTVSVAAEIPGQNILGAAQVTGGLQSHQNPPVIGAGGVASGASFAPQVPQAPGSIISIFGTMLSEGQNSSVTLPLETQLVGTTATIGGQAMPLLFASEGQVNVMIPFDIPVNTQHQVVVSRGTTYTVPESVTVAAAQPAVFTVDGSGRNQGWILVATPSRAVAGGSFQTGPGRGCNYDVVRRIGSGRPAGGCGRGRALFPSFHNCEPGFGLHRRGRCASAILWTGSELYGIVPNQRSGS